MWYWETFQLFWGKKWVCHCWESKIVLGFLVGYLNRWIKEYRAEIVWKWMRLEVGRPLYGLKKKSLIHGKMCTLCAVLKKKRSIVLLQFWRQTSLKVFSLNPLLIPFLFQSFQYGVLPTYHGHRYHFPVVLPPPPTYLKASLMTRIVYFYCFWDFHSYL